jgi:hypothetical protein
MRDTDYMKTNRHLQIKTYRDGVKVGVNVPVAVPFHCTDVVCSWSFWDWLKMLFRRNRTTTIRVVLDGDSVAMKRWLQGQDTCERCQQVKIGPLPGRHQTEPGYHHGSERWCEACYYADNIKVTDQSGSRKLEETTNTKGKTT